MRTGILVLSLVTFLLGAAIRADSKPSRFESCQKAVSLLVEGVYPKAEERAVWESFHVVLACSGMQGDPNSEKSWKAQLPTCPKRYVEGAAWNADWARSVKHYHPGADRCVRKAHATAWDNLGEYSKRFHATVRKLLTGHSPGQQCCYDDRGTLIDSGVAAGTPDVISPTEQWGVSAVTASAMHYRIDVSIIDNLLEWPEHVDVYHALGWSPVAKPRIPQVGPNLSITWEEE